MNVTTFTSAEDQAIADLKTFAASRGITLSDAVRLILYEAKNQERKP